MKKQLSYLKIYEIIAGCILLLSVVMLLMSPSTFYDMLDSSLDSLISDFKSHIRYTAELQNTYSSTIHACFPPLIYLFYHFLYLIIPNTENADAMYSFVYMIYLSVLFCLFSYICSKMFEKESTVSRITATVLIILSTPFVFGIIEQGNIVLLPMMLLAISVLWRNSNNKIKHELSLIFLAVAAGIKIYPAIFGLIYLIEKRYKETARLIVYGILFFFVPFIFTGGADGLMQFLSNQSEVQQTWGQCSVISIYSYLVLFGFDKSVGAIVSAIFAVVAVIGAFIAKKQWQKYFMLIFIMVMCPLWSGQYTVCFFLIPFFEFLNDKQQADNDKLYNIIYITLLSLLFSANLIGRLFGGLKISISVLLIFFIIIIQSIINIKKQTNKINKE